jgi:hypothetical protein
MEAQVGYIENVVKKARGIKKNNQRIHYQVLLNPMPQHSLPALLLSQSTSMMMMLLNQEKQDKIIKKQ